MLMCEKDLSMRAWGKATQMSIWLCMEMIFLYIKLRVLCVDVAISHHMDSYVEHFGVKSVKYNKVSV